MTTFLDFSGLTRFYNQLKQYIKQSDWSQTSDTEIDFIKNKPSVSVSGSTLYLTGFGSGSGGGSGGGSDSNWGTYTGTLTIGSYGDPSQQYNSVIGFVNDGYAACGSMSPATYNGEIITELAVVYGGGQWMRNASSHPPAGTLTLSATQNIIEDISVTFDVSGQGSSDDASLYIFLSDHVGETVTVTYVPTSS